MKQFFSMLFQDPNTLSPSRRRLVLGFSVGTLVLGALCLGTLSLLFGSLYFVRARLFSYFQIPFLAFLNLFPVVLVTLFLYFLTNRTWIAFLLSSVLFLGGSFVDYYKVVLRDDNLVAEDLKLIGDAVGIMGEYEFHLSRHFYYAMALCLLGILVLFFFCRGKLKRPRWRIVGCVVVVLLSLGSYRLWYQSDALYNSFENYTNFNRWKPTEDSASKGFVYSFLHSITDCFTPPPEGYSAKAARQLLAAYADADIPEDQKVNFVCVMLESYSDLSACAELTFSNDPYAAFHALQAESYCGVMLSDTMGGGTCNAERSFLTGYGYPHPDYRHETESFVQYFRRQGYVTDGSHPGHNWFYNRQNVNKNLGFDQYLFSEELFCTLTDQEFAYDDIFFPTLRQLYEARPQNAPYFNFSVSYQGHSPYDSTQLTWGTEYLPRGELSESTYYLVNNYLGSIADTGEKLAAFVDSFRQDEAPVVLVFFGDHKPTLGAGNCAYEELGISLDRSNLEGFTNYYATPYLIWANDSAKEVLGQEFAGTGPTISPMYLLPEVFSQCGYQGSGYLQYLRQLEAALPVLHSTDTYVESGVFTKELTPQGQLLLENFRIIQYYLRDSTYQP